MDDFVLQHLRCVICSGEFPNLLQCFNGHSHCNECLRKYEQSIIIKNEIKCSICRVKRGWSTNRQMYQLAVDCNVCMECGIEDCDQKLRVDLINEHRATCDCIKFACPLNASECKPMSYKSLLDHVLKSHKKALMCTEDTFWVMAFSDTIVKPKTFIFNNNIIQFSCSIVYDRRYESRLIIQACVIGYQNHESKVEMSVYHWNMLNDDYSKHVVCLECLPELNVTCDSDTVVLIGKRNYVCEENHAYGVGIEKIGEGSPSKPHLPFPIGYLDINEEYKEIHTITISFNSVS
jgi:hypothetical protein